MTREKLKKILSGGEGISVEFTQVGKSLPDDVFQSICAFLNRTGGDLLLGVADDGTVTGLDPAKIEKAVKEIFDLRPGAIIRDLDLLRPIYKKTAAYGRPGSVRGLPLLP